MEKKRLTRRQAIIRRRIFVISILAVLLIATAFTVFIISAISKGNKDTQSSDSTLGSSEVSQVVSSEESMPSQTESKVSSSESSSSVISTSSAVSSQNKPNKKLDENFSNLLLVNGKNPLPDNFDYSGNLMLIEDKYLCGWRNQLNKDVMPYVTAMIEAAWKDGVDLYILSPYRSYDSQVTLFKNETQKWINKGMKKEEAENKASTIVARPGTSEHHTGLAIDFNSVNESYENTAEYKWLDKNAQNYGFILRYTEEKQPITGVIHEAWHWRFVGINHAKKIKSSGFCLEEYLQNLGYEYNY